MQPSDFLSPFGFCSFSHRLQPTCRRLLVLRGRPTADANAVALGGLYFGPPSSPDKFIQEMTGSPELPGRPLLARHGRTPRRMRRDLARIWSLRCCLQVVCDLGHPGLVTFRGCIPMAHLLACLRFADFVTSTAQGSLPACWAIALTGRVPIPLDDSSEFQKGCATSYSLKLAVLGRTKPRDLRRWVSSPAT
jgi:hypothetical protein